MDPTRYAASLCVAMLCVAGFFPRSSHAATEALVDAEPQAVVVLQAAALLEHRLPSTIQIAPGRFVFAHEVRRACATVRLNADSIVLYLPALKMCEQVSARERLSVRSLVEKLTGHRQMDDPVARVQKESFVAISPLLHSPHERFAVCGCADDMSPEGVSMCAAQTRVAGTAIGPVEFLATDADTASITGAFSYQRDSDAAQPGLPPEVTPSCSSGSGTLQCTLSGTAPAPAGILQFTFDVTDGTFTVPLTSRLEVLAVGERIFADNFETPGCP